MYTPLAEIERQKALAQNLQGFTPHKNGVSVTSGLAQMLNAYSGKKRSQQVAGLESQNADVRQKEMDALIQAMSSGGDIPSFTHPDAQALATELAAKNAMMKTEHGFDMDLQGRKNEGTGDFGVTPFYARNPDGSFSAYQLGKGGDLNPVVLPEGQEVIPDSGRMSYNPYNISQKGGADLDVTLTEDQRLWEQQREQELAEMSSKAWNQNSSKENQVGMLTGLIGEAKDMANMWTTGFIGSGISKIPGTPAYDLGAKLDTVKANIGFDRLQEMRDNSPTGGALGQVSEMENRLLQAVWGNLNTSQSKEQFIENLDLVEQQVKASWDRINKAYEQDYGSPYFGSGETPEQDDIINQAMSIINGE